LRGFNKRSKGEQLVRKMKIIQTLVESQIKNGILDILKDAQPHFPKSYTSTRISVFFDDETLARAVNLTGWKYNTPMLTGLKKMV
jgi:hypothetical protein